MIHVAVLMRQYLDLVLSGEKTVECRLNRDARAPYEAIEPGERIYFKQSDGPYRATALVDHVLFESGLTPQRVRELRRDYDHLLHGDDAFWRWKRDARYGTLIWLTAVEPIDVGPATRRLQGMGWLVMEEEPAWRRHDDRGDSSFSVLISEGNLRNASVNVRSVLDRLPASAVGGATARQAAQPLTLLLYDGPTIETDIDGPRKALRSRRWGGWFRRHGVKSGDRLVFTPVDAHTYFVGLAHARG